MQSTYPRDSCPGCRLPVPGKTGIFVRDLHPGTVMKGKSKDLSLLFIATNYFLKTGNVF